MRLAIVAVALLFSSCTARTTPALSHRNGDAVAQLQRDLQSLFSTREAQRAQWAVSVYSLRTGERLFDIDGFRLMVPASVQKMLTSAVVAERLGWDHRYTTKILSTAPVGADGTIDGDVVIVGSGDPTINPRHPERWRAFDDWAAALSAKGVRIISGRLIGDDNAIAEPAWGYGWSWDDLHHGYGAEPSALQFNENQVEVMVGPGIDPGSRAIISTSPLGSGLVVDHGVTTVASDQRTAVEIARMPGSAFLQVRGHIAAGAKPVTIDASVENPTRFYLTALREALARNNIFVAGGVADVDELRSPLPHQALHELIVDVSPPLSEIVDVTLKWSRNIYAESLLLSLRQHLEPATGTRALEALRDTLRSWGVFPDFYLARDGSGLSRYNYVTTQSMIWLLTYLWMDPKHADPFAAALPVSGVSGTLATRMKGTVAEGRVRAKTGTMSHVRSLAGYVTTLQGETMAFAMIANDFRVPAAEIDGLMDRALERIVQLPR
jgi:D-alanyl-D-alanine carboxypeptidase/D-alanyl-D-alanine-endopeptidase (penicillin-binding protein 4)